MTRPRRILLDSAAIGPALVLGLLVVVAGLLLVTGRMHPYTAAACITMAGPPPYQPLPPVPSWWREAILVANVVGFAVGHASGHVRMRVERRRPPPRSMRAGSRIVQSVMIVFLIGGALLSVYEALSVVPDIAPPSFWPISYYVRCMNDVAPYQTLVGSAVVAFLLGHWLCQPGHQPTRRTS